MASRSAGGHSPYRNHISREPNVLPPQPHRHHRMDFQEYPKWVHFDDAASVMVQNAGEEAAVISAHTPLSKRKPLKAAVVEAPANDAEPDADFDPGL